MSKGIYTTFLIVIDLTEHTVNHTGCSSSGSDLSRVKHIQRHIVVGLIACTVRNRCTLFQSQFFCSSSRHFALYAEGIHDVRNKSIVEAEILHQEVSHLTLFEVPEHTFQKTADCRIYFTTHLHGDIVTQKHELIDFGRQRRFILLHPRQFGSSKVTWGVKQML